ncbi:MAG: UPF0182 family protein [Candidatus Rokuibacteriota bacterium]|nr:MAG: UPF0182 family protein [Candidatus Rokubacteria bacterium]
MLFGALALVILIATAQLIPLYTDWLWFQEVGYSQVFLTMLSSRGWLFLIVSIGFLIFLYSNLTFAIRTAAPDVYWELEDQLGLPGWAVIEPLIRRFLPLAAAVIAFVAGLSAMVSWETVLQFVNAMPFGATDPLFGRDLGFFVFTLPFWRLVHGWAMALVLTTLVLMLVLSVLQRNLVITARRLRLTAGARTHLLLLGTLALLLKSVGFWLDRFEVVYSPRGVVFGASYSDVYASLPMLDALAVLALLCAGAFAVQIRWPGVRLVAGGVIVLVVAWVGGLGVYPALLQWFRVLPNELAAERPFIANTIRMTRQAYGLDRIEAHDFPATESLDRAALERNDATIKNIRLWDHRPLLRTFAQLQEIRTYYQFLDVDIDRYRLNGEYRQLMLSPREMAYDKLPSRIWINEHLTFTHGYGLVAGPVNRITPEGLPEFFVKDMPPAVTGGLPKITRPEIYYGETSNTYALVGTRSQELDYPAGDQNVYATYRGRGGISIATWARKVLFAARFGEKNLLLSNDLTADSRLMMYRAVGARLQQIAPFFSFDPDPYIVVTPAGRLVWLIDGYTTTDRYPYSEPARVPGVGNYLRNAVKATVDAYDGTVEFYIADPSDPLVRTYARAFPGLLKPLEQMPVDLRAHLRYPEGFFAIQARMYATYHMEDPQVFYNKEDLWALPRRTLEGRDRDMEPYYTIMRLPGEAKEEFILLTLFNPSRRDNMIAWLAARSDPPHYGRLVVYVFPKQKNIYGPRLIDARIDQDPIISQQLSLWNQRGSTVIRGSLLAIPIEQSFIYVQPLYLAAEQGALPELRRVTVVYGNQIAMEPTLEQALVKIFGGRAPAATASEATPTPAPLDLTGSVRALGQRALEIYNRAQQALRRGDWARYGAEQTQLEETLRALGTPP